MVWDREDYLAETRTQPKDKDVYQELKGNIVGPLEKIIKSVLRKVRNRNDTSDETLIFGSQPKAWEVLFTSKDIQKAPCIR